ncbi:hypothetical protein IG631_19842 [Alternaria alternata]|nr:hypothetical protein IG631_19842 [Alternaria alternata]
MAGAQQEIDSSLSEQVAMSQMHLALGWKTGKLVARTSRGPVNTRRRPAPFPSLPILNTSAHLVPLGNRYLFRLADYVPSVDNTRDPTKNTQCDVDEEISGATALYRDR